MKLHALFWPVVMLIGILMSVMFVSADNTNSAYIYLDDGSCPFNDRYLVRTSSLRQMQSWQGLLMILLLAVTEVMKIGKSNPLHVCVYTREPVFAWTPGLSLIIPENRKTVSLIFRDTVL